MGSSEPSGHTKRKPKGENMTRIPSEEINGYLQSLEVLQNLLGGEIALANAHVNIALLIGTILNLAAFELPDGLSVAKRHRKIEQDGEARGWQKH